jgi:hypothetical protein
MLIRGNLLREVERIVVRTVMVLKDVPARV